MQKKNLYSQDFNGNAADLILYKQFRAYLNKALMGKKADYIKELVNQPIPLTNSNDEPASNFITYPEYHFDWIDEIENMDLLSELLKLNDRERRVLDYRYNHELSFREIGKLLDISENAASKIYRKTLAKIKERLGRI